MEKPSNSEKPSVAMIGLAVMGANLIRNIERNGFPVAVYNRTEAVTDQFMMDFGSKGNFTKASSLEDLVQKMQAPRKIIILVQAGKPVDAVVDGLLPLLEKGDIIIDGGNSYFTDTVRREATCKEKGIHFLGVGVSGGEEGALNGPSIMPGGDKKAWELISPMLDKISAKVDGPCTSYIGPDGAGHFVKMVHNGIEYGDMQLIAESYDLLKHLAGLDPKELGETFQKWNDGVLSSFLIEITAKIFTKKDEDGKTFLVDKILDAAGQKGTGKWTASVALDLGIPIPTLTSAVDARGLSSMKAERVQSSKFLPAPAKEKIDISKQELIQLIHDALYCSKILAYTQGFALLAASSIEWKWNLNMSELARIWKGGCIIRAKFLDRIQSAYKENTSLQSLLHDEALRTDVISRIPALRKIVSLASMQGVPVLSFATALSYFDSYRTANLPQNLTQAQRDFFGAHTYKRIDKNGVFHTQW